MLFPPNVSIFYGLFFLIKVLKILPLKWSCCNALGKCRN